MESPPQFSQVRDEEEALNEISDHTGNPTCCGHAVPSCLRDQDRRKVAICSIICGLSCFGIAALINSVKARTARTVEKDPKRAQLYSVKACKFATISIVVCWALLILIFALVVLGSYLVTLID